jgi:hypothetical protein
VLARDAETGAPALSILNGGGMGCNMDFGAPYAEIRDLLKPRFAALLPDKAKP